MEKTQISFQITVRDNVATALCDIRPGPVILRGDCSETSVIAVEKIPKGHKIALCDISQGEHIVKYGTVIALSIENIRKGSWVHLHCIKSIYDERSSHLDVVTGAPKDTKYE